MQQTIIRIVTVTAVVAAVAPGVGAEVFSVPASVRDMPEPREVVHTLESAVDGTRLGEQRSRVSVDGARLEIDVVTEFVDGIVWDERAVMDIRDGYRARSFQKTVHRGGVVVGEEDIDFGSGTVRWRLEGPWQRRVFAFTPDTYTGPMLALVLAPVSQEAQGSASFAMLTFRPEPAVYTIQADVMTAATFRAGSLRQPATKVRLKADLGPMRNVLLGPLIPTHYFWYTQGRAATFFAFEGQLGHDGHDLVMVPETPQLAGRVVAGPAAALAGTARR